MSNIIPFPGGDQGDGLAVHDPGRSARKDHPRPQSGTELVGPVLEGELVDDPPAPVDVPPRPEPGPPWSRAVQRTPVVPDWWTDEQSRRAAVRWVVDSTVHKVKFHALRAPVYAARLLGAAPRGAGRTVLGAVRWLQDAETALLLEGARGEPKAAVKLVELRRERAMVRAGVLTAAGLLMLLTWWLFGRNDVGWDRPLLVLVVLVVLGLAGRRRDKPIVGRAVVRPEERPLRSEHVESALRSIGIKNPVTFPAPIQRDGPGWRAEVDLPEGATASAVMEKRKELASALRRPLGAVWPSPDHEAHPGWLVLWVGRVPMEKVRAPEWPLAKAGQADLFRPVPFGHDQRMRPVSLTLMENNLLVGSLPGAGKSMSLRVVLCAAALDPRAQLRLFELKGTGDLSPFEPVAHHYGAGPSEETLAECMASLREVHGLLETRAKTIRDLPRVAAPENKVTPELAERRNLRLHPVVFAVDECQELFLSQHGKDAAEICTAIIKRGRALGIVLLLATQRPDKDSLPTSISANVGIRFCLRVMGHTENDMVLGSGMHRNGIKATLFTVRDKGIGWLVGASEDPQIVRSSYVDAPAAERIVARAQALREAAGTLSGYALGEQEFERGPDLSIIDDVLQVMPEDQMHSDVLCARLGEQWPSQYDGWTPTTLAAALRACDVKTKRNTWAERPDGHMDNRAGVVREDLLAKRL